MDEMPPQMPTQIQPGAKTKNPFKIVTIILSVVVLCLAGLSVFLFINRESGETCENPESDISTDCIDSDSEISDNPDAPVESPTSSNDGPYIADGYFYVPHWGAKFKLDDTLTDYGYSVLPDSLMYSYDSYVIGLSAVQKTDLIANPQARYYDDIMTCSKITITKTTQDMSNINGPRKVIASGDSSYVVYDYKSHASCDYDLNIEAVANKLTVMISNPENI